MLFSFLTFWLLHSNPVAEAGSCRPENSWSLNSVAYFERIVSSGDAENARLRAAFNLPIVVSSPRVTLVTDEAVCARAVAAIDALYTGGPSRTPVHVFRIGTTRLAVAHRIADIHVFDVTHTYLVTVGN